MKSASKMTNVGFAAHLVLRHDPDIEQRFPEDGMYERRAYQLYHDLHLHKPGRATDHEHERDWNPMNVNPGTQRLKSKGWEQRTPCICLEPPKHRADCTGARGVVEVQHDHGASAQKRLWQDLDDAMDFLKGAKDKGSFEYAEAKGSAAAVARCIALMLNPSLPDIDGVKKLAVARWKTRQGK